MTGLRMGEQSELIERDENGAILGRLEATISVQPYQTFWKCDNVFMQTAFKGEGYNLLVLNGASTQYWIASRCVDTKGYFCYYNVYLMEYGYVRAHTMCNANSDWIWSTKLFPILSLNASMITGNDLDGWNIK